ncbi:carbonic anhydrase [Streptomyces sp. SAI-208]|uniref:beta-class carbonic anhydrase n=2 Tax=unclassified Streptomyces TaxID=2593676 RepID=UPI00247DE3FE|nr:carbonic anhydrase [Streptomyces sp. SAI-090]MDH6551888.1 carbonic anhydrase [Streptomyces sp. SAI-041]MDH6570979.1 carbonic anhydrase [Streptomyces sp. SAI-117]MDH6584054.1 carbonic anhydrase [Streptomyces sp. SAI-133]MDH6610655.1 carbonic anhydrase [Streptomyces sp. SAI-208]MDH6616229.1 carbonic anhydrase [Streptomyces sp. SAI-135]
MTLFFPSHRRTTTAVTSTVMVMTTSASVPTEGAISRDGGVTDRLVNANERYAAAFTDPGMDARPVLHVAVVACMDARLDLHAALGLELGDCHTIRNAGGVVTDDVIRSLTISQRKLGTRSIVLIHHTGCGLEAITEDFRNELEMEVGQRPAWAVEAFRDVDQDVRQSMQRVRTSPFLLHTDDVRGFVFDVKTGLLREIDPA